MAVVVEQQGGGTPDRQLPNMEALEARLEAALRDRAKVDPGDMLGHVDGMGDQLRDALHIAQSASLDGLSRPRQVVVLGMGGSAIGGDLVRALAEPVCPVPINVNRDYQIPAYIGPDTLVVASSYSGNTEETLEAYEAARRAGAQVVAITTGGELARRARAAGDPVILVKSGMQPRAALGYSLVPLLVILHRVGLLPDPSRDVQEAAEIWDKRRAVLGASSPAAGNPAKALALRHFGRLPLIYGTAGWKAAVAYRWKCQINENAKAYAAWNVLPELNHNETVGWEAPADLNRYVEVVVLRDRDDSPSIARRIQVTSEIMRPHVSGIHEVTSEGESALARMMSLVQVGDYHSVYLAYLNQVDPSPVRVIEHLKRELARK